MPDIISGDTDGDGNVTLSDATRVLEYYAMKSAKLDVTFEMLIPGRNEQEAFLAADTDANGIIDITDAAVILSIYAKNAAGIG